MNKAAAGFRVAGAESYQVTVLLSTMYEVGTEVEQDATEAAGRGVERPSRACLYWIGQGVSRNYSEAAAW